MASPELLDFSSLFTPITDDQPTGADLREDYSPSSPYQSIKGNRNAARDAERKSIHDPNNSDANSHWRDLISQAPAVISKESKDLEIACWLTEALIRRNGAQGLRDGFKLIDGLLETFWDDLYPMPDEDGIETRVAPLSGLNGEGAEGVLIAPIRQMKITEGHGVGPFSLWEYQQALNNDKIADDNLKDKKIAQLGVSLEDIEKSVSESNNEFFINLRDDLTESIESYKQIGLRLDEHCGSQESPSTRNIIEILEECRGAVLHLARNKLPQEVTESPDEEEETSLTEDGNNNVVTSSAPPPKPAMMTRESAFKEILQLAEYFRKTEPHSPVSYMLEKAVRWGELPLEGLIRELITDNNSLERFSDLTGVKVEH